MTKDRKYNPMTAQKVLEILRKQSWSHAKRAQLANTMKDLLDQVDVALAQNEFDSRIHYLTLEQWESIKDQEPVYGACGALIYDGKEWKSLFHLEGLGRVPWTSSAQPTSVTCKECEANDECHIPSPASRKAWTARFAS